MFIIRPIKKNEASGELALLYKKIEKSLGFLPPHFELFATIDIVSLKNFVEYNLYFNKHQNIDAGLLPYLRLYIAQKECRDYCILLNSKILATQGITKDIVKNITYNLDNIPFEQEQILLLKKVFYAIYNANEFGSNDLEELYKVGFSDKDFYELLSYATNFMAKSKMIEVYMKYV